MARALVAIVLVAVGGCASVQHPLLQSPAAGGSSWRELTSEHFVLRTDYPDWAARQALQSFDVSARALIALAVPPGGKPPRDRIEVVAFEHVEDLNELADDKRFAGGFTFSNDGTRPQLTLGGAGSFVDVFDRSAVIMRHEIGHWLLHASIPLAPLWLSEGYASYWQSLRLEDGQAIVGSLPGTDLLVDWASAAEVMSADRDVFYGPRARRYYSAAWGIVYILYAKHGDGFARYLKALAGGVHPDAAWRDAFGTLGARELDAEMHEWFSIDRPWAHVVPMALPIRDAQSERQIAPADVHLLWSQLRPRDGDKHQAAISGDLATAKRLAPDSAQVDAEMARLDLDAKRYADALARVDAALARHPDDEELLLARGMALVAEPRAQRQRPRDLAPILALCDRLGGEHATAASLRFAALVLGSFGDRARAVALAERAVAKAPACASCFEMLALAKEANGDLAGAVTAAETAVRMLPDGYEDRAMMERLTRLKQPSKTR
jgi:tetratricopeptide (TPR) repeat protein